MTTPELHFLSPLLIDDDDRERRDFSGVADLADSIRESGLIHPPTVTQRGDRYKLIAGGCRLKAIRDILKWDSAPCYLREEMPDNFIKKLELEENHCRKNLTWIERITGIVKYHKLCKAEAASDGDSWTQIQTGLALGVSQTSVNHALLLFDNLGDEAIKGCQSANDALKLIFQRKEDQLRAELIKRARARSGAKPPLVARSASDPIPAPVDSAGVQAPSVADITATLLETLPDETSPRSVSDTDLFHLFRCGDALSLLPKLANDLKFHHIICDPPYGIDVDNMSRDCDGGSRANNIGRIADTHQVEQNIGLLSDFIRTAYDCVPETGFLCFWYDLDHHEKLQRHAESVGWKVCRWPFIWCKSTPCLNGAPNYNFTKSTEVCMILRRSEKARIVRPQTNNYIVAPAIKGISNPFVKPMPVWERLISAVSLKGELICDPFMGEGSSTKAVLSAGRVPCGCEIDEKHYNTALTELRHTLGSDNIRGQFDVTTYFGG